MAASPTSSSDLHGSLSFHHFQVLPATDGKPWILGKGAAGITYKATDTILRRSVALKVVDNAVLINEAARERLIEEARVLAALKHPNSAAVYYFGEEGNVCFYAMELVEGQSLEDYIRSHGSLSPRHALDVAAHVAAALGAAHDLGVVHRDVKPANIMLCSDGDGGLSAKLIDFGLAAPQRGASSGDASDEFAGTPLYASPEQLDGVPPDSRSDVYSLGATLFFMLGGRPPFDGKSIAELAKQHTMQEVPLHLLSGLPVEVSALVLRFMAKDPAARPIDGAEARAEIEEMLRRYRHSADRTASEWMRDRFAQVDQAGMLEGGILYKVAQTRGAEELAVFHFDNSARGLVAADRMRTAVPMVRAIKSSSPRRVLDMADTSDGLVVVCEWMSGTRLLSVLRVRRSLPSEEARLVLLPVAQALDEAAAAGMALPHVGLRDVFLQPLANAGTRLTQWQDLRVAVDLLPLAEASEVDINATVVGRSLGVTGSFSYAASEQDAASIVASLAYEVLGGTTAPRAGFYVPLPELSENANRSLRRVFEKGGVGLTASGLVDDLTRFQLPPSGNPNATTVGAPSLAPSRGAYRQMAPDSVSDSGIARRHRRLLAGSLIVLAMLLTAVLLLANRSLNSNVRARDSGSVVSQTTAPSDAEVISSETARVETGPAMDHKDRGTLVELDSMPQSQADQGEVSSGGFGATGGTDRQVVVVPDLDGMPPADDQREQGRKQGWRIRTLGGRDYVPVAQVADFYHMQLVGSGDDAVSLSSRTRIMEFVAGSREAHIDGVKHWLSFPVIIANGNPYLSRMDLAKTVDPAMRPQSIPGLRPVRAVLIDAAKGGNESGAVNGYGLEKDYNLAIAKEVQRKLQKAGLRAELTRRGDQSIPPQKRAAMARNLGDGTIFVGIR